MGLTNTLRMLVWEDERQIKIFLNDNGLSSSPQIKTTFIEFPLFFDPLSLSPPPLWSLYPLSHSPLLISFLSLLLSAFPFGLSSTLHPLYLSSILGIPTHSCLSTSLFFPSSSL